MNAEELVAFLREEIEGTFADLVAYSKDEPTRLHARAKGDPWSTGEVLEHVMLANRYLLILVEKGADRALRKCKNQDVDLPALLDGYVLSNDALDAVGVNDSFPWEPPAHMVPGGTIDAVGIFPILNEQRQALHAVLDRIPSGEGLCALTHMSVNDLGRIDVYRYIYFLLLHARRHIQQIRSILGKND